MNLTWVCDQYLILLSALVCFFHLFALLRLPLDVAALILLYFPHRQEAQLSLLNLVFDPVNLLLQTQTLLHSRTQQPVLLRQVFLHPKTQLLQEIGADRFVVAQTHELICEIGYTIYRDVLSALLAPLSHLSANFALYLVSHASEGLQFGIVGLVLVVVSVGFDLFVDVLEFGLHIDYARLQVDRVSSIYVAQDLPVVFLPLHFKLYYKHELFMRNAAVAVLVQYLFNPIYYFLGKAKLCEFRVYLGS